MIMDDRGNLYMGDLEENRIVYLTPDRKEIKVLASGEDVYKRQQEWGVFCNKYIIILIYKN